LLDKWLTDTEALFPVSDMDLHVPKSQQRTDIVAYLSLAAGR
jgi:hypothetical protein